MLREGIFITGTDTGVGKTQVTAGLAALLQRLGEQGAAQREAAQGEAAHSEAYVRLWKPVQSGAALGLPTADSYRLLHGSGLAMREADIASHTFAAPVAPWLAARAAGAPLQFRDLVADGKRRLQQSGCLLVEGAGGLLVPLAEGKRMADLAAELSLPLLIIARTGLGTVNHTLLTVAYARQAGLEVLGVILNDSQSGSFELSRLPEAVQMAKDNAQMIEQFGDVPVLGILPWMAEDEHADAAGWAAWREQWTAEIESSVHLNVFYDLKNRRQRQ
ncbi:dethiobiotin synthase [Paenibacillus psychroresistens]|uniref:ATP-dependent dethiobiotin synthetase BioD n=1 Tax=Paenibacillus psychroresistens TaxID=1778678 RepID=A0A6B8RQC2_9BACL|nr:dethiobiotin synthase [Paenibacillus psychroresistens]QGQ98570.1 dethiobiotin synthase [Paenibacillus psychroresistens]